MRAVTEGGLSPRKGGNACSRVKGPCTNEECACEITVVTASQVEDVEEQAFICVCGEEMERPSRRRAAVGTERRRQTPR